MQATHFVTIVALLLRLFLLIVGNLLLLLLAEISHVFHPYILCRSFS